jgi:hypothetical protein
MLGLVGSCGLQYIDQNLVYNRLYQIFFSRLITQVRNVSRRC